MVCQRCGTFNESGDRFCGGCGNVLITTVSSPVSNQPGSSPSVPPPVEAASSGPQVAQYGGFSGNQAPAQPLAFQPTQYAPPPVSASGAWPGQSPGAGYAAPPPPPWAPPPWVPPSGAIPSGARVPPPASRRRLPRWQRILLILVAIVLVLTGAWIFIARSLIHNSVDGQIRDGLQSVVNQIFPLPSDIAVPGYQYHQSEINNYIAQNSSQLSPLTDLQVSLQQDLIVATFKTFGFGSTVQFSLDINGGTLIATNVSVSGLLSWVESADEMTSRLNDALGQIGNRLGRRFQSVQVIPGSIVFTFVQPPQS